MPAESIWKAVSEAIGASLGEEVSVRSTRPVAGGCINEAQALETTSGTRYFVKFNRSDAIAQFVVEAEALAEIAATGTVRAPRPVCHGIAEGQSFLALEYIEMGRGSKEAEAELGRRLAAMHGVTRERFGWRRDNFIGSTPQVNTPLSDDWVAFYRDCRLAPLFRLARCQGCAVRGEDQLLEGIGAFFEDYQPAPSLLHGDLWGGNAGYTPSGEPVIYDPAVYWGDRETDLAFTEMFGGFGDSFYDAYQEAWPLDADSRHRTELYNLYHLLNHAILFGGGYASQAQSTVGRLIRML